jgi:hypothetical protein
MDSPNVMTSDKTHKRILPATPIAVSIPRQGNVSLFYKGQVFESGQGGSSDGIYQSVYVDKVWKGGLDAPPIFPTPPADPARVAAISWSGGKEVSVLHRNLHCKSVNCCINSNVSTTPATITSFRSTATRPVKEISGTLVPWRRI